MLHATCMQGNRVGSWLFVVGSQTTGLIPNLSFGHNLCLRCPNGSCEPILDIYVSITFQCYKKRFKVMGFGPCNCSLKIWESIGTPTPKMGAHLGVWVFILTLSHTPFWPMPLQALAFVVNPRPGLRYIWFAFYFLKTFMNFHFFDIKHYYEHSRNKIPQPLYDMITIWML
jgi:hypothetical protein